MYLDKIKTIVIVAIVLLTMWLLYLTYIIAIDNKSTTGLYNIFQELFLDNSNDYIQNQNALMQNVVSVLTLIFAGIFVFFYGQFKDKRDAVERKFNEENAEKDRQKRFDEARNQQGIQEILRISAQLHDPYFYTKVIAPCWEVAVKWRYWKGNDGDKYRHDIIAGSYLYIGGNEQCFESTEEANQKPYQNIIRGHPHYIAYGISRGSLSGSNNKKDLSKSFIIDELSEHNALTIWLSFWARISQMTETNLVQEEHVRATLHDFYIHWYPFFTEYRRVVELIEFALVEQNKNSITSNGNRTYQLLNLEKIFKADERFYPRRKGNVSAGSYAVELAQEIWMQHFNEESSEISHGVDFQEISRKIHKKQN